MNRIDPTKDLRLSPGPADLGVSLKLRVLKIWGSVHINDFVEWREEFRGREGELRLKGKK